MYSLELALVIDARRWRIENNSGLENVLSRSSGNPFFVGPSIQNSMSRGHIQALLPVFRLLIKQFLKIIRIKGNRGNVKYNRGIFDSSEHKRGGVIQRFGNPRDIFFDKFLVSTPGLLGEKPLHLLFT